MTRVKRSGENTRLDQALLQDQTRRNFLSNGLGAMFLGTTVGRFADALRRP